MDQEMAGSGFVMLDAERMARLEEKTGHIESEIGGVKQSQDELTRGFSGLEKAIIEITMLTKINSALEPKLDELSKRVRTLENWRWLILGGAGAMMTVLDVFGPVIRKYFGIG